jgi:eukaryotic-like serine/threonine-protein kinase
MWQVGDIISDDYQILHVLGGPGKSGMGIVYVCYNRKSRLPVAVKTFQDQYFRDNSARERFRWEAEAWIKLEQHHNIVRAFFVNNIEGRPFIFMEYIVGDERYGADLGGWINSRGLWKGEKPDCR